MCEGARVAGEGLGIHRHLGSVLVEGRLKGARDLEHTRNVALDAVLARHCVEPQLRCVCACE